MSSPAKPKAIHHPSANRARLQRALVSWFRKAGKTYPWRETTDPYAILVSETMLQQTQIKTVLDRDYYGRWMARFPDLMTLAAAPEEAVLRMWEGLGYYSRARNLHRLAREVSEQSAGQLPETLEGFLALPGVGRYTAGAVLSFAHDLPVAVVDANVLRVFARLFDFWDEVDGSQGRKRMWSWADSLVPAKHARLYNSGLMELGQSLCRPKQPRCDECPLSAFCQTREPESLPRKSKARATVHLDEHVFFQVESGRIRLVQEQGRRRNGLWKLPACPEGWTHPKGLVYRDTYSITHHRVTLHVYEGGNLPAGSDQGDWVPLSAVEQLAMASPFRKAVDRLLSDAAGFHLTP